MRIYIFRTSSWAYCGGGAVAIAESIEQAAELLNEINEDDDKHIFSENPFENDGRNQWELVEALETNETIARAILIEYNYA